MLAYTYIEHGKFELIEKPKPGLKDPCDAIVRVTLGSICTSDLHVKHGSVPRAVPGIRSACTPESPFNLLRHHGKVLLCACFFTESTLEKCYDISTQQKGGRSPWKTTAATITVNRSYMACSYAAYLRPLLRYRV